MQIDRKTRQAIGGIAHTGDFADLLAEIDHLQHLLLECRAVFPTLSGKLVGAREFSTAPYYKRHGYNAQVRLEEPITEDFIRRQRQIGRWINENALIRLFGILNYRGFYDPKIDRSLPGHVEMDILRRIRNALTKTPVDYQPESDQNRELREAVIRHFALKEHDIQEHIPLPIDAVIEPIFEACRTHIRARA